MNTQDDPIITPEQIAAYQAAQAEKKNRLKANTAAYFGADPQALAQADQARAQDHADVYQRLKSFLGFGS